MNLGKKSHPLRFSSFVKPFAREGSCMFCSVCGCPMATAENGDNNTRARKEVKEKCCIRCGNLRGATHGYRLSGLGEVSISWWSLWP